MIRDDVGKSILLDPSDTGLGEYRAAALRRRGTGAPAGDSGDGERLKQLRWITGELAHYGLGANVTPDYLLPHVNVNLPGTYGEQVYLTTRDGRRVYQWRGGDVTHSVADPAGAARRIATTLRREQRDRR